MFNKGQLAGLMKQAQAMQDNLKKAQEELAHIEVEGESGAGLVKVLMTCKHDVKRITIDPSLLADDKDMLEDLVAAAFNAGAVPSIAYALCTSSAWLCDARCCATYALSRIGPAAARSSAIFSAWVGLSLGGAGRTRDRSAAAATSAVLFAWSVSIIVANCRTLGSWVVCSTSWLDWRS